MAKRTATAENPGLAEKAEEREGARKTLLRVLGYLRPYLGMLVASIALAIVVVTTTLSLPVLSGQAVDVMLGPGEVDFARLGEILRSICLMLAVTAVAQWCMTALTNHIAYDVVRDLRVVAFDKLQVTPLSTLDAHDHGDIVSRIVTDVDQFSNGLLLGFQQLFSGVLTIVLTLAFMFRLSPVVALVVVCVTPLSIVVAGFIAKRTHIHFREQSERRGEVTSIVEEMIGGVSCVEAFDMCDAVCERFDQADDRLRKASFKAVFYSSTVNPTTRFVNALVYAGVCVFGAFAAIDGIFTVGELTAFLGYASQYTKPFNEISGVIAELQNSVACAQRIFELIDGPEVPRDVEGAAVLEGVSGAVELDHVSFSYVPDRPLIRDLCLEAKPGQRIAIVGPTGCGKTTLINLLMRFYDVGGGSILVDGHDIREVTRASLRSSWGMVLQDTWVKNASVRENIALGRPQATADEVEAAAREAYADGFIRRLPRGYDTVLGEDGGGLSAGERQLLCIARVMLAVPPMLILDEATSSIDTRTELCIQRAFDKLMEGRTSFVVAHRLSTIKGADLILAMQDGRIVERGTHEELLARDGFYASLYNAQFEQE